MPQLKCDEWPEDGEPTTVEREVLLSASETAAIAEFHDRMAARYPMVLDSTVASSRVPQGASRRTAANVLRA